MKNWVFCELDEEKVIKEESKRFDNMVNNFIEKNKKEVKRYAKRFKNYPFPCTLWGAKFPIFKNKYQIAVYMIIQKNFNTRFEKILETVYEKECSRGVK